MQTSLISRAQQPRAARASGTARWSVSGRNKSTGVNLDNQRDRHAVLGLMDQNPFGEEMALSIQNLQGYVWVVQGNEGKIFHPELRLLLWLHQRQADPE